MEIPAWLFISFWAIISITFLHLGFHALDETELSNSVSPVVMFLFKHSLALSSCFSSCYALKIRAQSRYSVRSNYVLLVYVLFSFIFSRTIEGILIWHALKAIFAWLLQFLSKLYTFLSMIFQITALLFVPIFRILWMIILPITGVVGILPLLLQSLSSPSHNSLVTVIFTYLVGIMYQTIYSYTHGWLISATAFLCVPIFTFVFYLGCLLLFCFFAYVIFAVFKDNFSELETRAAILLALEISLFFASAKKRDFSPFLVLSISHLISVLWARFGDYTVVHTASRFVTMKREEVLTTLKGHKAKKFIEFAIGTVGAVLFQNFFRITSFEDFFRITSFSEVAAFLYFTVSWLANLVLLGFCGDFGIFNFLLANVVVGVGQFGLHGDTWLALGAALLLYALRLKLESISIAYEEAQRIQFSIDIVLLTLQKMRLYQWIFPSITVIFIGILEMWTDRQLSAVVGNFMVEKKIWGKMTGT